MKPERPRVSVGIPVYNGETYIDKAIESVLAQTWADFELYIIDDASTDGTLGRVRRFGDSRLRIIRNSTKLGHEGNWNRVLREAKGEFIKLLPCDDVLHPDCLRKQVEIFDNPANSSVVLTCCSRNIIDANGRVLMKRSFKNKRGRIQGLQAVRECIRSGTNLIGEPGSVLMKTDNLSKAGVFSAINFYVIDLDLWARVLLHGDLFVLPEPLCSFRVASGSASIRVASSQSKDFMDFIGRLDRSGLYGVRPMDRRLGAMNALKNRLLRKLFYRFIRL
jgi:glycosyltransferase involved in cell wall biosynthesis